MKRFALAGGLALACILSWFAYAANRTPSPIVGPTETGEWDAMQQQVVDMARFKPGFCTATTTGAEAAMTATCNGASGVITTGVSVTIVSNAVPPDKITLTNNKIQTGDFVLAMLDTTGCAANSLLEITSVQTSAGQVIAFIDNASATSCGAAVKATFLVVTTGNPN